MSLSGAERRKFLTLVNLAAARTKIRVLDGRLEVIADCVVASRRLRRHHLAAHSRWHDPYP